MWLTSRDFADKGKIPRICTCEGEDLSPALNWGEAPRDTRGFVLLCNDPDAPGRMWRHWAAYDIPAAVAGLPRGAGRPAADDKFKQANNDFGRLGYGGTCPPRGHGPHRYRFRLLALSIDRLPIRKGAHCRDVEREARKHVIAEAELVGTSER
jgi:Raf kinase inhibitor-like YbhB/YbcL family protein